MRRFVNKSFFQDAVIDVVLGNVAGMDQQVVVAAAKGFAGRYMGRWFLQLPINKKHKLYLLTEFQPVYDWESEHFSFWVGPEFGKAFTPSKGIFRNGGAIYFKPGFGVDPDARFGDRDWTFEFGVRFFFGSPGPDSFDKIQMMR